MRSAAAIVFIALIAAVALYCAQRKTVARGASLAATLVESNPSLQSMTCDDHVPIGVNGAKFACRAEFKNGDVAEYTFAMNRDGDITVVDHGPTRSVPRIKKTSDPWGD
ncbi:MAG: hypothetical protein HOV81_43560 [Kofleriaceae bacterium]|nr:hypothetical protein [Kofleriaceae bacterium]